MLALLSAFTLGVIVVLSCLFIYMTGFTAGEQNQIEKKEKINIRPMSTYENPTPVLYTAKGRVRILDRARPGVGRYDIERVRLMDEALSTGIHWDNSAGTFVKTGRVYKLN